MRIPLLRVRVRIARETRWDEPSQARRDPQLLFELASKRGLERFSGLDLAARELPQAAQPPCPTALLEQHPTVATDQRSGDDRNKRWEGAHVGVTFNVFLSLFQQFNRCVSKLHQESAPMIRLMRRIFRDRRGATAVEYGLILALIVIAMLLALSSLAQETNDKWNYVSSKVNEASDRPHG